MTSETSPKPEIAADASTAAAQNNMITDAVLQSMSGIGDVAGRSRQAADAISASGAVASQAIESLNSRAVAYSKKAAEDAMTAAKALASAKTPQEAVALQTNFATTALNAYIAEFSAVSSILVETFNQSFASFKGVTAKLPK